MSSFLSPTSLEEALLLRAAHPRYTVMAGGTDLMVASKDRLAPAGILNLFGMSDFVGIDLVQDECLRIGACTTYAQILEDQRLGSLYPILRAACREVGASQIQSRGTIGGNVATSSPVGDSLPALLALDARIQVASSRGTREVAYQDFLVGYRQIDLAADELIVAIVLPRPLLSSVSQWRKVGTRRAQSISKVMMAATAQVVAGKIVRARIALGAVADRTLRALQVEQYLVGKPCGEHTADVAARLLTQEIAPISDLRSSAEYRMAVARNLVRRFVLSL